jgi:acetyl esterase/lipase
MRLMRWRIPLTLCLSSASALAGSALAASVSMQSFLAQPQPAPDATIRYGVAPVQGIDLYLPKTEGPHPVVILIHGGCWTKTTAGRDQLRVLGRELANRGIAVWSIGYRRVDEEGGAYPGIFQDVAQAIDLLSVNAAQYKLDTSRVVAVGNSAGAHLAHWAACRGKLPQTSPLYDPSHFPVRTVIGLGGLGDIERATGVREVCGPAIVPALVGQPSTTRPDVYADTSPSKMLPNGAHIVMITGAEDTVTPPAYAQTYVDEVKAAGGTAELVIVKDADHFDVVTISTPAWQLVTKRIMAALER